MSIFSLKGRNLGSATFSTIAHYFSNMSKEDTTLDLSSNRLTEREDLAKVFAIIPEQTEELILSNNDIGLPNKQCWADVMSAIPKWVKTVDLSDNYFCGQSIEQLEPILKFAPNVTHIKFTDKSFFTVREPSHIKKILELLPLTVTEITFNACYADFYKKYREIIPQQITRVHWGSATVNMSESKNNENKDLSELVASYEKECQKQMVRLYDYPHSIAKEKYNILAQGRRILNATESDAAKIIKFHDLIKNNKEALVKPHSTLGKDIIKGILMFIGYVLGIYPGMLLRERFFSDSRSTTVGQKIVEPVENCEKIRLSFLHQ